MSVWLIWFIAGLGLGVLEMVVPGFIIIFFGAGCMGAAVVAAIAPGAIAVQALVFVLVSVGLLVALRRFAMKMFAGRRESRSGVGESSIEKGTRITVDNAIPAGGRGRVRYRGTWWDARTDEGVDAGAEAEIVGVDDMNRSCLVIRQISADNVSGGGTRG